MIVVAAAISAGIAQGATIRITSGFAQQNSTPAFNGSFVMTFDVTGLPVADPPSMIQNGPSVSISNLSILVTFANGTTDTVTGGSGSIFSMYNGFTPTVFDFLSFSAGNISGEFALIDKYTGNGGVLTDDQVDSSLIHVGSVLGYLNSPSSQVVTPEPSSLGLACGAALAMGLWLARKRKQPPA